MTTIWNIFTHSSFWFRERRSGCCSAHWLFAVKLMVPSPVSSHRFLEHRRSYLLSSLAGNLSAGFLFHTSPSSTGPSTLHSYDITCGPPSDLLFFFFFAPTLYSWFSSFTSLPLLWEKEKSDGFSRESGRCVFLCVSGICLAVVESVLEQNIVHFKGLISVVELIAACSCQSENKEGNKGWLISSFHWRPRSSLMLCIKLCLLLNFLFSFSL